MAGSREGIWWQPRPVELGQAENDVLILSNSSAKTLAGTLWLSDAAGKRSGQRLSLTAHQTMRLNVHELVRAAGLTGQYGGIQFEVAANAGALDSVHFMYDETAKYSASLKMFSRDPGASLEERTWAGNQQWTTWAPMLALRTPDPAVGLPARTELQPAILVRNTTAKKLSASITLSWRGDSGRGKVKLPELHLAPFATEQLQIGTMQKQLGIPDDAHWALVTLTSPASPDDLIAIASSHDKTGRYNLETPFSDNLGSHFVGGEWRADATHNMLAAVTNGGTRATEALLTLHYDNGKKNYEMQQTIPPGDQMWLNFADLIHNRVPDRKGNVLPEDATSGTYDLEDLNPRPGSLLPGSLALDQTWGFQIRPPVQTCCNVYNIGFNPSSIDVPVNGLTSTRITADNSCGGEGVDISDNFTVWGSDNSSIAKVTTQKVQGVAPGSTRAFAQGKVFEGSGTNCAWVNQRPTDPVNVGPYQVEPIATASQFPASCPSGQAGWNRNVTNQLQYVNGSAYAVSGIAVSDLITVGSRHDLGSGTSTGTSTTTGDGSFPDNYSVCSTACPASSGETDALQNWTASGVPLPHANSLVYKCSSITIDGK